MPVLRKLPLPGKSRHGKQKREENQIVASDREGSRFRRTINGLSAEGAFVSLPDSLA